jgi:hypothetical protein
VTLAPGIHRIGAEEYHADPWPISLSASCAATLLRRSPLHAHYEHPRLGNAEREATDEMDSGTILHALVLGVGRGMIGVDAENWRTKKAQEEREKIRAEGAIPVLQRQLAGFDFAADQIVGQLTRLGVELCGDSEPVALWEGSPGSHYRAMIDHLILRGNSSAIIYDLKTMAESAHPRVCAARIAKYGEEIQVASNIEAIETLHPELRGRVDFLWLFAEQNPPHAVTIARPSGAMLELGRARWARAKSQFARCLAEGRWPGYGDEIVALEPPAWSLAEEAGRGA